MKSVWAKVFQGTVVQIKAACTRDRASSVTSAKLICSVLDILHNRLFLDDPFKRQLRHTVYKANRLHFQILKRVMLQVLLYYWL